MKVTSFSAACCALVISMNVLPLGAQRVLHDEGEGSLEARHRYFHDMRAWPFGRIPQTARLEALAWIATHCVPKGSRLQSSQPWRQIGPTDLGGRITALAVHPTDGTTIWAGAADGGVWKSTDRGVRWSPVMDFENAISMGALAIDPTNPLVVYAGTGEPAFNLDTYAGAGLYKSTDGGVTWAVTGLAGSFAISCIVVDPRNGSTLFAGAVHNNAGLYRSNDAGSTWTRVLVHDVTDITQNPQNPDELWVGGGLPGVMHSIDGGRTFIPSSAGIADDGTSSGRVSIRCAPSHPSTLYALVHEGRYGSQGFEYLTRIYRSDNSGSSWYRIFDNNPNFLNNPGFPQGEYNNVIAVKPDDPDVVVAGGVYAYRTIDGGLSWGEVCFDAHPDHHALVFDPTNPLRLYDGNDGGVYQSEDVGETVLRRTNGLAITQFYAMAIDQSDSVLTYGGTQDNGTVTTAARNFSYSDPGFIYQSDGFQVIVDPDNPSILYHEIFYGGIRRTNVTTRSTTALTTGLDMNESAAWSAPLVMDPTDHGVLYCGRLSVYRLGTGQIWSPISDQFASTITAIGVSPLSSAIIYAGSSTGELRATTDGGATWRDVAYTLPTRAVTDVVASETDSLTAWVTFSGYYNQHIYRTTDGGTTWTSLGVAFPDIPVNTLVVDPENEASLYAGTDVGVLSSSDGGTTWFEFGLNLPRAVVADMQIHNGRRVLRVATHGRSMWEIDLPRLAPRPAFTSPTGGEKWVGGSAQTIAWNGLPNTWKLSYSLDDGAHWILISDQIQGATSYAWQVPDTECLAARIQIEPSNDSAAGARSRSFTILKRRPGFGFSFAPHASQIWGLVYAKGYLWATIAYGERAMLMLDPTTLTVVEKVPIDVDTAYRYFAGLAYDSVRGTFFLHDVTSATLDGTGPVWILEIDRDGHFLRRFRSPCGYGSGLVWLPDSGHGTLVASDLIGSQNFFRIDPDDGSVIDSIRPSRIVELGPAGLAPGPQPGTVWQVMQDFSFDTGPRGSAASVIDLRNGLSRCDADLYYTSDSTVFFPPYSWGKIVGTGIAVNPRDETLFVANFDGTIFRVIPCEPGEPAGVRVAPQPVVAAMHTGVPNPFNTQFDLTIDLNRPSNARIVIYDMNGAQRLVVADGSIPSGVTTYHVDGRRFASGVYRCVLYVEGESNRAVTMVCVR